jgi:PKD repeat protein
LTVSGPGGTDTLTISEYIHVSDPVTLTISLNQTSFTTGDTVTASLQLTNDGPNPVWVELKRWVRLPDQRKLPISSPHIVEKLNPSEVFTKDFYTHTFTGSEQGGDYKIGVRVEHPFTGKDYSVDTKIYTFTP